MSAMKKMRLLVWAFVIMIIGGTWLADCSCSKTSKTEDEADSVVVFLDEMRETDTICDEFVAYRNESDSAYEDTLSEEYQMPPVLPSFSRIEKGFSADSGNLSYSLHVDYPKSSITNAKAIKQWLVDMIREDSCGMGDGDSEQLRLYELYLPVAMYTDRFVTYTKFSMKYEGGLHGNYTERFISYDYIHKQEIDYDYLFLDGSIADIVKILLEEVEKTPRYKEWNPDVKSEVFVKDSKGRTTGKFKLPQPGLSKEGVVFSFQPYSISCFAAGVFHFTIPYERLTPYLTKRAKWCLIM